MKYLPFLYLLFIFKRTNLIGMPPNKVKVIVGKKAKKNFKFDQVIKITDIIK